MTVLTTSPTRRPLRFWAALSFAALLCAATLPAAAQSAGAAAPGAPAGFVAPPEPKPDETQPERARSQPGNNAPFWRGVRDSGQQPGSSSLPGAENGILIQQFVQYPGSQYTTAGEAWRQVRNRWILPYGGALLGIVVLALALMYFGKGPLGSGTSGGRQIERFTPFERAAHWANAFAFIALGISGIVLAFGKYFLLPVMGLTLFGWLAYAMKNIHNFAGPLFAVSLLIVFVTFVKDNLPRKEDVAWIKSAGGAIGGHAPSHRFNAGEKFVFWGGILVLGAIVVVSGLALNHLLPGLQFLRGEMQIAHMVHAVAAILMMAMFIGHMYMGSIGMKGAYEAMRNGYVDEVWAREHHELWYEDIRAGKIPAQRSAATPPDAAAQPRTS